MSNDSETQNHGFDSLESLRKRIDDDSLPPDARRLILRAIEIYTTKSRTKIARVIAEDFGYKDIWYFEGYHYYERIHRDLTSNIRKEIDDNPQFSVDPLPDYIHIGDRKTLQKLAGLLAELISEEDVSENISVNELLRHEKVRALFQKNK